VVDNACTDNTAEIAERFGARIVEEPIKGYTRACQAGFEAAQNSIIAMTDADTRVLPNWLSEVRKSLSKEGVVGAYGPATFHDNEGYYNWLAKYAFTGFLKLNSWLHKPLFLGANMAISRAAFEEAGGFKLSMESAPDVDLSQRVKQLGKVVYNGDMKVQTSVRRLSDWGFKFFVHHALNYFNVVWLRRPGSARDFDDIR